MTVAQEKKVGQGITVSYNGALLGQIKSITPPAKTIPADVDVTDLDALIEQFIPSKPKNVGEWIFTYFWTPGATADDTLDTAFDAYTVNANIITFANLTTSKTWTFSGYIKALTPAEISGKDALQRTVAIKLTTAVTVG